MDRYERVMVVPAVILERMKLNGTIQNEGDIHPFLKVRVVQVENQTEQREG